MAAFVGLGLSGSTAIPIRGARRPTRRYDHRFPERLEVSTEPAVPADDARACCSVVRGRRTGGRWPQRRSSCSAVRPSRSTSPTCISYTDSRSRSAPAGLRPQAVPDLQLLLPRGLRHQPRRRLRRVDAGDSDPVPVLSLGFRGQGTPPRLVAQLRVKPPRRPRRTRLYGTALQIWVSRVFEARCYHPPALFQPERIAHMPKTFRFLASLSCIAGGAFAAAVALHGQSGTWQPPNAAGEGQNPIPPVYQEPHHRQLLKSGSIRLIELQIPPGDSSWFHMHDAPVFYLTVADSQTRTQNPRPGLGSSPRRRPWSGCRARRRSGCRNRSSGRRTAGRARRLLLRQAQVVLPRVRGRERRREQVVRHLPAELGAVRLVARARSGHGCSWMSATRTRPSPIASRTTAPACTGRSASSVKPAVAMRP